MGVQRYQLENGRVRDYLSLSSQGGDKHYSPALSEWIQTWSNETIGSGRGEKANDVIVAKRQKKKGRSWSKKGSRALAILKVEQLNKNLRNAA